VRALFYMSLGMYSRLFRYMFDEPSSYLDIRQRLTAAEVIRQLLTHNNYVIAVEHDLSVLDYLSDFICVLYGKPSMYGVVTMPYSVREGVHAPIRVYHINKRCRLRHQHLPRWLHPDGEPSIPRRISVI
jgi:ATP-binding cassette subfamily E protein 1